MGKRIGEGVIAGIIVLVLTPLFTEFIFTGFANDTKRLTLLAAAASPETNLAAAALALVAVLAAVGALIGIGVSFSRHGMRDRDIRIVQTVTAVCIACAAGAGYIGLVGGGMQP